MKAVKNKIWYHSWNQTNQVMNQVWIQVQDQVWLQVGEQVEEQVGHQVWNQVRDQLKYEIMKL